MGGLATMESLLVAISVGGNLLVRLVGLAVVGKKFIKVVRKGVLWSGLE